MHTSAHNQQKKIKKAAVLGSGVMGSRIACHFANIGLEVLLLDIPPKELNEEEQAKGLSLQDPKVKNRVVNQALQKAIKSSPSPLYHKDFAKRIRTGNFEDDLAQIAEVDWVIEAVVEHLPIKQEVFEQVEAHRKPGTLISTNTSGIPIHMMLEGRSEDFQQHFLGTHFFNPPRYLELLEIIPTEKTKSEVVDFFMDYGRRFLGKTTVGCKDTPAFIANRIGVWALMDVIHLMQDLDLNVTEVDKLTGTVIGHPKSATFRTADVVGLDTFIKVADNLYKGLQNDEAKETFKVPDFVRKMEEQGLMGEKSGSGFYKKTKDEEGNRLILGLNLDSLAYEKQARPKFATLDMAKTQEDLKQRLPILTMGQDKAGEFYRRMFAGLFSYASMRVPEVADQLYKVDDALRAGFGWELGPFETWDALGFDVGLSLMRKSGHAVPDWVNAMAKEGVKSFYKTEDGRKLYYDIEGKGYKAVEGTEGMILLDTLRDNNMMWENAGATVFDIGDGILNLEFHTKMNTMGSEVIQGIHKAIELAEQNYRGLVIANEGKNFSAGANLSLILMYAIEQEFDEIDFMVRGFQQAMMRVRYSSIPVVVAPHGMALGGGCEVTLHADRVQALAETYIGLVEAGVGLIPAGGGSKEMALKVSDRYAKGDVELNILEKVFRNLGMAQVATSAEEARDMYILEDEDRISLNKNLQISEAKMAAIALAEMGYTQPPKRQDIKMQGQTGIAMLKAGITAMKEGHYISAHDAKIGEKLAHVLSGGDLSYPQEVSEDYLLDLEREAFLSLCGERKTLERIESVLKTGKPLRN